MNKLAVLLLSACLGNFAHAAEQHKAAEDPKFQQMFDNIDANHDGKISRPEAELNAPAMAETFERIDSNRDGYLSKQEIKAFIAVLLKKRAEFNRRLKAADTNKDGKLSLEESQALPMLHDNFDTIDTNHDGQLTGQEIAEFLRVQLKAEQKREKK